MDAFVFLCGMTGISLIILGIGSQSLIALVLGCIFLIASLSDHPEV